MTVLAPIDDGFAPTNKNAARSRVAAAAIWWVKDQSCSEALAELEDAVDALLEVLTLSAANLSVKP